MAQEELLVHTLLTCSQFTHKFHEVAKLTDQPIVLCTLAVEVASVCVLSRILDTRHLHALFFREKAQHLQGILVCFPWTALVELEDFLDEARQAHASVGFFLHSFERCQAWKRQARLDAKQVLDQAL